MYTLTMTHWNFFFLKGEISPNKARFIVHISNSSLGTIEKIYSPTQVLYNSRALTANGLRTNQVQVNSGSLQKTIMVLPGHSGYSLVWTRVHKTFPLSNSCLTLGNATFPFFYAFHFQLGYKGVKTKCFYNFPAQHTVGVQYIGVFNKPVHEEKN